MSVGLEDIVVTARRQAESFINVPATVTVLSRDMIDRSHVSDLTQIAQLAPNVMIVPTNNGAAVSIRGVGTAGFDPGIDQSVAINIDGVTIGRAKIVAASQFDIQQIEVLKGPQALFFGKNSPAGVISITSAAPTRDFEGRVRIGYETEAAERFIEGHVSGPLSDTLSYRVAGRYTKMSGWMRNTTVAGVPNLAFPPFTVPGPANSRTPKDEAYAGRVSLRWAPTSDFTADLRFTYGKLKSDNDGTRENYCTGAQLATGHLSIISLGLGAVITDPNSDCKLDQRLSVGILPEELTANWAPAQRYNGRYWNEQDTYLGNLTLNYDFGDLSLASITGFAQMHTRGFQNIDGTSFAVITSAPNERSETWSQEFRLASELDGPINFVVGAFFEDQKRSNVFNPLLGFVGFDADNGGSAYTFSNIWETRGNSYSGFGQLRWAITEQLELSGGARYSHETKDAEGQNLYTNLLGGAFGLAPVGDVVAKKNSFSNWSPEVTLRYKLTDQLTTYAAYKTGYKSGGLSTAATISSLYVANPELLAFDPETSKGWEIGLRGELLNRTVRFDLTAFRYTFDDLQLTAFDPVQVAYFVSNAGKARTTGIEGSVAWRATQELTLNASSSYTEAVFVEFENAQCPTDIQGTPACGATGYDRSGQPLPRSPKFTFAGGFDYVRELDSGLKLGFGGTASWTSSFWTSELGSRAGIVDGYWRFDGSIRAGSADDKYEIAVIGRNLTNEYNPVVTSDATLSPAGNYGASVNRPRQIVLQGTVRF